MAEVADINCGDYVLCVVNSDGKKTPPTVGCTSVNAAHRCHCAADLLVGSVRSRVQIYLTRGVSFCYPIDVVSVDSRSCQKTKEVRLMTLHNKETR